MAEETVNSLVTCEKSESDVSNSTGKASSLISNQESVPHYLRASTGSCHDFCKYGHKHAFEEKERYPFRKRIIRTPSEKQNPAISVSLVERKKATVLKRTVLPNLKSISLKHRTSHGAINLPDPPEIIKRLPSEKVEMSPKCDPLSQHKKSKAEKRMNNFSNKHSPSFQSPPMRQSSCFQVLKSAKKVEKAEKAMSNLSLKSSPSVGPQTSTKKVEKDEKARNNLSQKSSPSVGKQRAVSESSSFFYTPQSINGRVKSKDDMKASRNMVVTKASAKKLFATPTSSLSPNPSMNRCVITRAKKSRTLKAVSPLKDQNRIQKEEMEKTDGEKAPEKTLHVIMVETKNNFADSTEDTDVVPSLVPQSVPSPMSLSPPLSPSLSSLEGQEGEDDDAAADGDDDDADADGDQEEEKEEEEEEEIEVYDDEEEELEGENGYAFETTGKFFDKNGMANNDAEAVEGNLGKTLRKGVVFPEAKDPRPVKLQFKRGKVVDLQSENNGPRRLRFRQGRVMEENHDRKGEIRRRIFKKKGPDGDGNGTNPSNEKVVLRHQDMQARKDAQGLFNNVIEETASKLVESRKSKVKALVGAFETVISLQDIKPSPQTVS